MHQAAVARRQRCRHGAAVQQHLQPQTCWLQCGSLQPRPPHPPHLPPTCIISSRGSICSSSRALQLASRPNGPCLHCLPLAACPALTACPCAGQLAHPRRAVDLHGVLCRRVGVRHHAHLRLGPGRGYVSGGQVQPASRLIRQRSTHGACKTHPQLLPATKAGAWAPTCALFACRIAYICGQALAGLAYLHAMGKVRAC